MSLHPAVSLNYAELCPDPDPRPYCGVSLYRGVFRYTAASQTVAIPPKGPEKTSCVPKVAGAQRG